VAAAVDVTVIFGRFVEGVDIALVRAPPVDFGEQPLRITFEDLPIFVDRGRSRDLGLRLIQSQKAKVVTSATADRKLAASLS
jgi:hypothetical protein